ncbi:MAG: response regulator [Ferruginibacter sp.]
MMQKIKRILLVDDNEDDNWYHERIIKKNDSATKVIALESGLDALALLKEESTSDIAHPELILLDINMPGMNGWEFLEEYKKIDHKGKRSIVVIMLTTSDNPDDLEKAHRIDILSDIKTKPLTNDMLNDIIAKYFSEKL